ncbi:hypothetical protein AVEN_238712-1 [Araneus ventricosus]|uniref:Uncharacterized protein n=1 Tax=Araneus ventricosus TaxID=182803 RepID=A0A4Y2BY05_ARAVE|nr:hypothetical protein AVEN_238712-1 [Araneus ventricosus]
MTRSIPETASSSINFRAPGSHIWRSYGGIGFKPGILQCRSRNITTRLQTPSQMLLLGQVAICEQPEEEEISEEKDAISEEDGISEEENSQK